MANVGEKVWQPYMYGVAIGMMRKNDDDDDDDDDDDKLPNNFQNIIWDMAFSANDCLWFGTHRNQS